MRSKKRRRGSLSFFSVSYMYVTLKLERVESSLA